MSSDFLNLVLNWNILCLFSSNMDPFENQLSSFGGGGHDPFASHAQHMQHVQQMQQQQGGGHDPFASHARHMQQVQQMHQQQGGNHARHMQQVQQMQQQMMGGMMGGMGGMNMAQQMQQMQQQMMGGMNDGFGGHMLGGTSRCGWFPLVSTCCKKKGSHLNLTRVCSLFCCLCVVFFLASGGGGNNGGTFTSFSSSSSSSTGADGKTQNFQSQHTSSNVGGRRVSESKQAYSNSDGADKVAWERMMDER